MIDSLYSKKTICEGLLQELTLADDGGDTARDLMTLLRTKLLAILKIHNLKGFKTLFVISLLLINISFLKKHLIFHRGPVRDEFWGCNDFISFWCLISSYVGCQSGLYILILFCYSWMNVSISLRISMPTMLVVFLAYFLDNQGEIEEKKSSTKEKRLRQSKNANTTMKTTDKAEQDVRGSHNSTDDRQNKNKLNKFRCQRRMSVTMSGHCANQNVCDHVRTLC